MASVSHAVCRPPRRRLGAGRRDDLLGGPGDAPGGRSVRGWHSRVACTAETTEPPGPTGQVRRSRSARARRPRSRRVQQL